MELTDGHVQVPSLLNDFSPLERKLQALAKDHPDFLDCLPYE